MLFILVESSHLTICQIPLIHLLLLLMKKIRRIFRIFMLKILLLNFIIINFLALIDCQDSQLVELNVSNSLKLRGNIRLYIIFIFKYNTI